MNVERIKSFLLRHEYLIWAVCLCALLRLPSLLEPYWYGDEGIYLTLGQGIRKGLQLYRDIHDNKPPVVYLLAAISGSVFWYRMLLLLWNTVAIVLFHRLAQKILDPVHTKKPFKLAGIEFPPLYPSVFATFLFAIVPFFAEGNIANGEIFMIMPTIGAMLLLVTKYFSKTQRTRSFWVDAVAGILFSIAFLTKVPSLFDAAAAGVVFYVIAFLDEAQLSIASFFQAVKKIFLHKPTYIFIFAFLLPILATIVYYSALGVGEQYIKAAFAQNVGYLSSWKTGTHEASKLSQSGLMNRAVIVAVATIFFVLASRFYSKKAVLLFLWFAYSLFGALLSERPYPHYLIQVIPPAALLVVYAYTKGKEWLSQRRHTGSFVLLEGTTLVVIGVFIASIVMVKFWYYPLLPYYTNYISFVTGQKTKEQYISYFDPRMPQLYARAEQILARTTSTDSIFIWGDLPTLYSLTRRLPPGRYTSSYHIKDFNGFEETMRAIEKKQPKLIIVDSLYEPPFPELAQTLDTKYIPLYNNSSLLMYRLRTSNAPSMGTNE